MKQPFGSIARRFAALPGNTRGLIWISLATLAFVSMIMLVRQMSKGYNIGELAFWRAFMGLVLTAPIWISRGRALVRNERMGLHLFRNLVHFIAVVCWFYAVANMNLSVGMSLQFTIPLLVIVMAIFVLGEKVDAGRWIATAAGFVGVLVILRPGAVPLTTAAALCIVSAVGYAASNVATKVLMRTSTGDTVVFWMNLMHIPLSIALAVWLTGLNVPPLHDLPFLVGIGFAGSLAHWLLARAFQAGDASVVMIVDFTKLPLVALGAFVFFGEVPDVWAWVGGAIIVGATYYVFRRDARAAKRRKTEGAAAG
jgi:drug/metabolite transporter (DMT)-like permease